jgi:hypothetical protein
MVFDSNGFLIAMASAMVLQKAWRIAGKQARKVLLR